MDCVSPILDIASRLWDCASNRAVYIRELPQDLKSLTDAMKHLKDVYTDVKERVEREEKLQKKRTHAVDGWIKSVEAMEKEVNDLLAKGDEEIQKKCLGTCCPRNCRASYKMGKMVRAKMEDVASKKREGQSLGAVTELLPSPAVIERPLDEMVGVDSFFNHVCMQLQDEKVTKLGLYGMGGVGKTTLLNKINNDFLKTRVELDAVIWVTVSRPADAEKIQQVIFKRLGIPDTKWDGGTEDQRKEEIFNVLKTKKFVLLLDDVWEALDLLAVGIPPLRDGSKSKMVLTTRDLSVCRQMGAKAIEVSKLAWADAFALFQKYAGEDTIKSHSHIQKLAEIAARECDGLPLAPIVLGRAMAAAKTPEEWDTKLQLLRKYPDKFPGMEKHLFTRLAFSYDSLQNEATKMCFLYCSLYPEDHEIHTDELIQLWIGEGFLDEYNDIKEARNGGKEIIATLSHACLLQEGTFFYVDNTVMFVKMHDVIRDMALWLVCRDGNKNKEKFVVVDRSKLVTANEIEKWKGAQRISLFGTTGFEEHLESANFPELQTLMLCMVKMVGQFSFPSGFFNYMPNITVLNFAFLRNLCELPVEIGELSTLQYLNLTATQITRIPEGLRNLKRLRCLILGRMSNLRDFPSEIISGLSSLRLFSFIEYDRLHFKPRIAMILEELEGLKCIEEVSIYVLDDVSIRKLTNSLRLRTCLKFLCTIECDDITVLQLSSLHLEKLHILRCGMLQDVVVMNSENGVQYSTLPSHHSMSQLSHVVIESCTGLKKLTWLAYASNLKFLLIKRCLSLREVIPADEFGTSEIKSELNPFMRLSHLRLGNLQNLRSISRWNLPFPSLKTMHVIRCPKLRKLPFDSNITRSRHLEEIVGEQQWWEKLEWENEAIKHHLTPYYKCSMSWVIGARLVE